jgi:TPR repeat protein
LAEGRSLLAKGDLEGARRAFRRAADSGSAEGALALGSTYDPASLARYGLKGASADPESAKFWYRRAHELTQAAALKTEPAARK